MSSKAAVIRARTGKIQSGRFITGEIIENLRAAGKLENITRHSRLREIGIDGKQGNGITHAVGDRGRGGLCGRDGKRQGLKIDDQTLVKNGDGGSISPHGNSLGLAPPPGQGAYKNRNGNQEFKIRFDKSPP